MSEKNKSILSRIVGKILFVPFYNERVCVNSMAEVISCDGFVIDKLDDRKIDHIWSDIKEEIEYLECKVGV